MTGITQFQHAHGAQRRRRKLVRQLFHLLGVDNIPGVEKLCNTEGRSCMGVLIKNSSVGEIDSAFSCAHCFNGPCGTPIPNGSEVRPRGLKARCRSWCKFVGCGDHATFCSVTLWHGREIKTRRRRTRTS